MEERPAGMHISTDPTSIGDVSTRISAKTGDFYSPWVYIKYSNLKVGATIQLVVFNVEKNHKTVCTPSQACLQMAPRSDGR
jgi:hypothetical protein